MDSLGMRLARTCTSVFKATLSSNRTICGVHNSSRTMICLSGGLLYMPHYVMCNVSYRNTDALLVYNVLKWCLPSWFIVAINLI